MQPELVYSGSPWLLKQQRERRAQHPSFARCGRCRARRCHWEALRARPASSPAPAPAPPPPGRPPGYVAGPGPDILLDADPLDPLSSGEREFALSLTPESEAEVRAVGAEGQRGLQLGDRGPEPGETSTSLRHQRGRGYPEMRLWQWPIPSWVHHHLRQPPPKSSPHPGPISPPLFPFPPISLGLILTLVPFPPGAHYPLPQSYPHPDPIPSWDLWPPWSHPYLEPNSI